MSNPVNTEAQITTIAPCTKPPAGWRCTRGAGHDGPCAAIHVSMDLESIEQRADKTRVAAEKAVRDWNAYARQPDISGWERHRASMQALAAALK